MLNIPLWAKIVFLLIKITLSYFPNASLLLSGVFTWVTFLSAVGTSSLHKSQKEPE
jgi:hypothetical protein